VIDALVIILAARDEQLFCSTGIISRDVQDIPSPANPRRVSRSIGDEWPVRSSPFIHDLRHERLLGATR
jgi:hypothetical protein